MACFVCNRCWWSASSWFSHMKKTHGNLKEADYFVHEEAEQQLLDLHNKEIIVKQEVLTVE